MAMHFCQRQQTQIDIDESTFPPRIYEFHSLGGRRLISYLLLKLVPIETASWLLVLRNTNRRLLTRLPHREKGGIYVLQVL